ncbi:MAG: M14 family metallopeptidase [Candidatus Bathyarchaeota archaeon]|nr:M14 family metallopeptidase [Candidatus Bathyarchaeota archaeon]
MRAVPSPEEYLGFRVGADRRLADWPEIVGYFGKVAAASDRVRLEELGKSTEGNPFILATVSSSGNLRRLDELRGIQMRLSDPEGVEPGEAERLVAQGKTVVLITCSIHSTEVGGSQMSMELLHRLATGDDAAVREILENTILLLVPSLNPDGNRLVCDWYKRYLGTKYEGTSPPMVYHKYAGHDNNRDWFMFTLQETRLTVEKVHNVWHPQIVYDIHQMGQKGPRLYVPPYIDPIDPNVDPVLVSGTSFMGLTMADALTTAGKAGVNTHWEFDGWTPARAYQHYHGGIRILSEAASADVASPVEIEAKELEGERGFKPLEARWNHVMPWGGGKWSLRDIVDYEFIAAIALLGNAAKHRERWLRGSLEIGRRALNPAGGPYAFVIPKKQPDMGAAHELLDVLRVGDVRLYEAKEGFTAGGVEYPEGSIVVPVAQPYGRFAKTMLERQIYPDLRKSPNDPPEVPYDVTAQTLGLQMGVNVVQVKDKFESKLRPLKLKKPIGAIHGSGKPWYLFSAETLASTKAANMFLGEGFKLFRAEGWTDVDEEELKPGAFIIEAGKGTEKTMKEATNLGVDFYGVDELPDVAFEVVRPRIGVYKAWLPNADEGWLRMVLEEYGFEFQSLTPQDISQGGLAGRVDVRILPDMGRDQIVDGMKAVKGADPTRYEEMYRMGLGVEGTRAVLDFLGEGGSVIALNKASTYAIKDLMVAAENPLEGLKEHEFYIPGSILRVTLDETHPVAYGYPREAAVYFISGPAFKVKEGYEVAKYPEANPLLSGWILGEKQLRGLSAVADFAVGRGRVILFGFPPHFRNQARGTFRMLFNAIYYCASGA